jgi:hypothetical protein
VSSNCCAEDHTRISVIPYWITDYVKGAQMDGVMVDQSRAVDKRQCAQRGGQLRRPSAAGRDSFPDRKNPSKIEAFLASHCQPDTCAGCASTELDDQRHMRVFMTYLLNVVRYIIFKTNPRLAGAGRVLNMTPRIRIVD